MAPPDSERKLETNVAATAGVKLTARSIESRRTGENCIPSEHFRAAVPQRATQSMEDSDWPLTVVGLRLGGDTKGGE